MARMWMQATAFGASGISSDPQRAVSQYEAGHGVIRAHTRNRVATLMISLKAVVSDRRPTARMIAHAWCPVGLAFGRSLEAPGPAFAQPPSAA